MRNRVSTGQVVGMVYLVGIVLLISLAGAAHAANEGDTHNNTYYGTSAGFNLSGHTGQFNAFFGYYAGTAMNSGTGNTFIGHGAGYQNVSGSDNVYVGTSSGNAGFTGSGNTCIGADSCTSTSGTFNVMVGYGAGFYNVTGADNVFLGSNAGFNETGSNLLYIANSGTSTPLIKGDFSAGTVTIYGSLTTASDERLKKNIMPLDAALKQIMQIQGVSYEWKEEFIKGKSAGNKQIGLIAQEVEKVMPELVLTDSNGYKAIAYDKLAPVLIEAVKEQQKTIQEQKKEIDQFNASLKEKDDSIKRLEKALEKMERRMVALEGPALTLALK